MVFEKIGSFSSTDENEPVNMSRRDFLKAASAIAGSAFLQGCGESPKWKFPVDDSTSEGEGALAKSLSEVFLKNQERSEEATPISSAEFDKMFAGIANTIPNFDTIMAKFSLKVKNELVGVTDMLPALTGVWFAADSSLVEKRNFPLQDIKKNIEESIPKIQEEVNKNIFRYIKTMFQLSGAMFDKNKLEEFMTQLVRADFGMGKFTDILSDSKQIRSLYYRLEMFVSKIHKDPFTPFGVVTVIDMLNKIFFPENSEKFLISKAHHSLITLETILKNSGDLFTPESVKDKLTLSFWLGLSERLGNIPAMIFADSKVSFSKKIRYFEGKESLGNYINNRIPRAALAEKSNIQVSSVISKGFDFIYENPSAIDQILNGKGDISNSDLEKVTAMDFLSSFVLGDNTQPHIQLAPKTLEYLKINR